jgi:hypothetical protein
MGKPKVVYTKTVPTEKEMREKLRKEQIKKLADSLKTKDRVKAGSVGNGL